MTRKKIHTALAAVLFLFFIRAWCPPPDACADITLSRAGLHLTAEEQQWLNTTDSITIAGPRAFPPFHYFDENGKLNGISADYIRTIMGQLGVSLNILHDLPWPKVLEKAESGEIDLIACIAKTEERKRFLTFSRPYLSFPLVILSRKDAPFISGIQDLHGKTLAIIKKNATPSWLARDSVDFVPYYVESPLKKIEAVSLGRVDAGIENLAAASYIIQNHGLTNVKVAAPTPYGNYNLHMAVRKDLPELLGIINKVLDFITPEQHTQMRSKWLSVRYEHGIDTKKVMEWITTIVACALCVLTVVLIWNRRLKKEISERRQVLERTERLNSLNEKLLRTEGLTRKLKLITDGIIPIFNADFARIWMIKPSDLCDSGCTHLPAMQERGACTGKGACLHLLASSGRYSQTNGIHQRVPLGHYKIGNIAEGTEPTPMSNDVTNDPGIHDREWAKALGLKSFAGYRLMSSDGNSVGTLALFSQHPVTVEEDAQLKSLAGTVAQIIQTESAREALHESEEKYRELVESTVDLITRMDRNGRLLFVNDIAEKRFGLKADTCIGRPVSELIHPDDRERFLNWFEDQTSRKKKRGSIEVRQINTDTGECFAMLWVSTFVYDDQGQVSVVNSIARDITELKENEEKLRESRRKYKQLVDDIGPAIMIYSHTIDGSVTYVSPSAESVIGRDPKTIQGQSWKKVLNWESGAIEHAEHELQTLVGGKKNTVDFENSFFDDQGHRRTLQIQAHLITDTKGKPSHVEGTVADITERKRAETERENLISELKEALENVKALTGLLPICAKCKKIRDDTGYWNNLESYIQAHSDVSFSHGLCVDCADELYGSQEWYIRSKQKREQQNRFKKGS